LHYPSQVDVPDVAGDFFVAHLAEGFAVETDLAKVAAFFPGSKFVVHHDSLSSIRHHSVRAGLGAIGEE